ncbi:hypothetical protein IFM89_007736 [Coptis chinensis]|uniref:Cardiolipin synthase N-terminal domain-containing protein n=1 Tax=Coptis chinensis TaxID=261450 RepID=A0A835M8Z1_9MAGN|nr:hypothetical protein IFM89_007736 [Coptis chinensis]
MFPSSSLISGNFSSPKFSIRVPCEPLPKPNKVTSFLKVSLKLCNGLSVSTCALSTKWKINGVLQICHNSLNTENPKETLPEDENNSNKLGTERDWTTSILLFALWTGLMYYVFVLTPNQTPSRDMYFLEKLLNLKGDDGFEMNKVLVSLWYIMGLWSISYSMLLLPSGRSSKDGVRVWPFLVLSCFGGAYALLPYFVLWKPPPPSLEESELGRWPLNFLESKLTAVVLLAAGLGVFAYAALANADVWTEFYQYCRESKFIHVTFLDFTLLSTFAPFWVYNDMTARKWTNKGSWILPLTVIPFLGPALYLLLRPPLSAVPVSSPTTKGDD